MDIETVSQYEKLVEYSTDSITLVDEAGIIQFKNDAVKRILGYEPNELTGENVFDYIHPDDVPAVRMILDSVIENEEQETGQGEFRFRHKNGEWVWVESTIADRTDTSLNGCVINSRSIDERKQREQQLVEERVKYSTLVEQSNDGIAIIQDKTVAFINSEFTELTGYESWEITGQPFLDVIDPRDRELVEKRYTDRLDPDVPTPPSRYEIRLCTGENEQCVVELNATQIQYDGDTAVLATMRDVTERTRYEEELEQRNTELELLNRMVRHDIRNDMTIILSWGELLEEHIDETGEEHLEKVLASGEHVVELTEIARDYVEVLTSQGELERKPMSLSDVLSTELALRRESFPEAEFVVSGEIPSVAVLANEMLGSVFRNLLTNAVQHNDSDEPFVELTVEVDDEQAVIDIADNGPGISDSRKETVFGRGEKGLDSPGTGIGLYLVDTLITQYGGDIEIRDNDPQGSLFSVTLPLSG
ncbi:PAS domain S-box protein [Halovenus rubra]|uniref:histidine kinase n=2 Tax=Halovenus rubra TaxID=869890 RepID=A0ABD5X984_9EURY|nr:PAS domain S-box protein [Halovenus rubra]